MDARTLTAEDQPAWRDIRLDGLKRFPQAFLTTYAEAEARSAEDERALLARSAFMGIFEGEALIAMGAMRQLGFVAASHRAEIGPFYVRPAHQGGAVARVLMEGFVAKARSLGVWQLELFVAEGNPRAQRFYERQDFQVQGRLPNSALVDGVMLSDNFMTRDLRR